jgi:TRAP-type C4-dicarboxylate transport system permease small subunit
VDWIGLIAIGVLVAFIFVAWPGMKNALENSPEGSSSDWMSAIIPIGLVVGFVALLIAMVS